MARRLNTDSDHRPTVHGSKLPIYLGNMRRISNQQRQGTMNRGLTGTERGRPGRTGRGPQR